MTIIKHLPFLKDKHLACTELCFWLPDEFMSNIHNLTNILVIPSLCLTSLRGDANFVFLALDAGRVAHSGIFITHISMDDINNSDSCNFKLLFFGWIVGTIQELMSQGLLPNEESQPY